MNVQDICNGDNMGDWSPYTNGVKKASYGQSTVSVLMGKAPASRRLQKLNFQGGL